MGNKMSSTATMNMITGSDAEKNDFISFFIEVDRILSQRISENSYIIGPSVAVKICLSKQGENIPEFYDSTFLSFNKGK